MMEVVVADTLQPVIAAEMVLVHVVKGVTVCPEEIVRFDAVHLYVKSVAVSGSLHEPQIVVVEPKTGVQRILVATSIRVHVEWWI